MSIYLERYAEPHALFNEPVSNELGIIVTIPCYNEPDLLTSLEALRNCIRPKCHVEIIVLINESEGCDESISARNTLTLEQSNHWKLEHNTTDFKFLIHKASNLPKKKAGVGLARKMAMDEAVRRFDSIDKQRGIITCFDADSTCDYSYLIEIERYFENNQSPGCSIYFEHPLKGDLHPDCYKAVHDYELHLRYYINAQRYAGLPYAFHTVGSSMAVTSEAYQKCGGMNKRKAGEDFYFLNKVIAMGSFGEINTTRIIPSPRESDRVPFGTGRAVNTWRQNKQLLTYNPDTFVDLKVFVSQIENLYRKDSYNFPVTIETFLREIDGEVEIERMRKQSTNMVTFKRHFFNWFDAFMVMKFVHYVRDKYYENQPVDTACLAFLTMTGLKKKFHESSLIDAYRHLDRQALLIVS